MAKRASHLAITFACTVAEATASSTRVEVVALLLSEVCLDYDLVSQRAAELSSTPLTPVEASLTTVSYSGYDEDCDLRDDRTQRRGTGERWSSRTVRRGQTSTFKNGQDEKRIAGCCFSLSVSVLLTIMWRQINIFPDS